MAVGKPLGLRLFLEGVEVPVISAAVQASVNAPATASVQVVPLQEVMELKPRTMVHLFYLDVGPVFSDDRRAVTGTTATYRCMFVGEFIGFSYVKSPQSRAVVLQCVDHSSYWDSAHATAIDYGPNGNQFTHDASLIGSNAFTFNNLPGSSFQEVMVGQLSRPPRTAGLEKVGGLAGGIIRLVELFLGLPNQTTGVNDFFAGAELRCRILEQIAAEENDTTAANQLNKAVFREWLLNGIQQAGQQITLRDLMKILFQYIFYEAVPNPLPKYEPGVRRQTDRVTSTSRSAVHALWRDLPEVVSVRLTLDTLASTVAVLAITHTSVSLPSGLPQIPGNLEKLADVLSEVPLSLYSSAARSNMEAAADLIRDVVAGRSDRGIASIAVQFIQNASHLLATSPGTVQTGTATSASSRDVTLVDARLARLKTVIIRPDCFFAAPPRCNVIFPDQYASLQYERMLIGEVTRVMMRVDDTLIGQDKLLSESIVAPNINKVLGPKGGPRGYRSLMPHERHTGIIPRMEWLPDTMGSSHLEAGPDNSLTGQEEQRDSKKGWASNAALFHLLKYRFAPRQLSVSGRFNPMVVCGFPGLVIDRPFVPSEADLARVKATSTGAVSDADAAVQLSGAGNADAPAQFLGMVGAVSHSIDQSGGVTSVSMHHVRRHDKVDDEFLDSLSKTVSARQTVRYPLVLADVVKLPQKQRDRMLGILVGVTAQDREVLKAKAEKSKPKEKKTVKAKLRTSTNGVVSEEEVDVQVTQVGASVKSAGKASVGTIRAQMPGTGSTVSMPARPGKIANGSKGLFGTVLGVEVPDGASVSLVNGKLAYTRAVVYEEVETKASLSVPPEETMRPSWFSTKYSNEEIGRHIYQQFFGCDSIVDYVEYTGEVRGVDVPVVDPTLSANEVLSSVFGKNVVSPRTTVKQAVNLLAYEYGQARVRGVDVDEFVRAYTYRPVATIEDILGSGYALTRDEDGKIVQTANAGGRIGFHSNSVDPEMIEKGGFAGLMVDAESGLTRASGRGEKTLDPSYDVRKEKRDAVMKYVLELGKGPAFKG